MDTKKLSRLQRWILCRAAEKPDVGKHDCDMLTARVLHEFYRVPTKSFWMDGVLYESRDFEAAVNGWHWQIFSRKSIGTRFYNSRKVAIAKAFRRLEERGFAWRVSWVYRRKSGIDLTPEGEAAATYLRALWSRNYGPWSTETIEAASRGVELADAPSLEAPAVQQDSTLANDSTPGRPAGSEAPSEAPRGNVVRMASG